MLMRNVSMNYIKNLVKVTLLATVCGGSPYTWAANGIMPVDDIEITLPTNEVLRLRRVADHAHTLTFRRNDKVIWIQRYEQEFDRLWDWAFFVPIVPKAYVKDLDQNGLYEVAIATWDGGNNMANRTALVFTIGEDAPRHYATRKFNLEYGKSAYP